VTDIFREVEEDVRRERLEKLWKEYGDYVLAAIAVVVLAVAGYQFWTYYHTRQIMQASDNYMSASQHLAGGDAAEAVKTFSQLAKEAPSGYQSISRLELANSLVAAGNFADAVAVYKEIEKGDDPSLAAIARVRHAWAIVDFAPKSEVASLLAPLTASDSDWKYSAREVLAYSDFRNGDTRAAIAAFKGLADHPGAPPAMRLRAVDMVAFISGGAGHDVGSVPEPEKKAPPTPENGTP
jgi:hypothetical protein